MLFCVLCQIPYLKSDAVILSLFKYYGKCFLLLYNTPMALCDEDMQKYRKCFYTVFTGISYKLSGDTSGQLYLNAPLGEGNLNKQSEKLTRHSTKENQKMCDLVEYM